MTLVAPSVSFFLPIPSLLRCRRSARTRRRKEYSFRSGDQRPIGN
jgi:hypothetical protein